MHCWELMLLLSSFHQRCLPAEHREDTPYCSQQQSPELTAFQDKRSDIRGRISHALHNLAEKASELGLISTATRDTILNPLDRLMANERTSLFMSELESSIKLDPKALHTFLDALRVVNEIFFKSLINNLGMFYT